MATPSTPDPKDVKRLEELYKKIQGYNEASAKAAAQLAISNGKAAEELIRLESAYSDLMKDIEGSRTAFANIVDSIKGMTNNIGKATSAFKGLEGLASKLQYHQEGINRLSTKELETLQKRVKEKAKDLEFAKKQTLEEIQQLAATRNRSVEESARLRKLRLSYVEISNQIDESESSLKDFNAQIETAVEGSKSIESSLGLTGAMMKGMSKIPFLGNLPGMDKVLGNVEDKIAKIQDETGETVSKTKAMGMAFKEMGPVVGKALFDPLSMSLFVFKQLKDIFLTIDSGAGELAKGMNMSYKEALAFRNELGEAAKNANDAAVTTKRNQESYMAISQALGANADINEKELKTFTKLREQAGYTNDELVSMYKMSLVTGETLEDTTKEFLGGAEALAAQKGLAINVKQLMKETANVSNATKLSLVGGAKGLAEAAVAAKALGSDLGKVSDISGKLLNFEDSISAELEAELLTGKQINLETARLAALNGDMATVASEIKREMGGSADFAKMNRIQQEAFAAAVGMSREELANTLVEQEALQHVGVKTAEEAKKKYDLLRQTMTAEEAAKALGDDQLAKQYEQQNLQERFNQTIEKLKDMLSTLVDGPFGSFMAGIAELLSNVELIKGIFIAIGSIIATRMVVSLVTAAAAMAGQVLSARAYNSALNQGLTKEAALTAMKVAGAEAVSFGAVTAMIVGGLALVGTAIAGFLMLNDGAVDPDGGLVVSKPKGGLVAQYNKDDYIVGTTNRPGAGGGGGASIDYDRLAAVMSKVNVAPVVNLDGRKISDNSNTNTNVSAVKQQ
jgi:hypothetical protein